MKIMSSRLESLDQGFCRGYLRLNQAVSHSKYLFLFHVLLGEAHNTFSRERNSRVLRAPLVPLEIQLTINTLKTLKGLAFGNALGSFQDGLIGHEQNMFWDRGVKGM